MKPSITLGQTRTPDGAQFTLQEHDGEFYLKLNGRQLMSTTATVSELRLADLSCGGLAKHPHARVLIGGLGLGFSLKRVLELVSGDAKVHVAELLPEVVEWNRQFLQRVNGRLLDDKRVSVLVDDVFAVIRNAGKARYDAILLDVDNGPTSFVQGQNSRLYSRRGLDTITRAMNPGAKVAFWSATEEPAFLRSLTTAGFEAHVVEAKSHDSAKRAAHRIYVGQLPS
jgi:spermidine synthase